VEIICVFIRYADWITGVINLEYFGAFPSVNKLLINSLPFQACCSTFSIQLKSLLRHCSYKLRDRSVLIKTKECSKPSEHPVLRMVLDIVRFYEESSIRKPSERRNPAKLISLLNVTCVVASRTSILQWLLNIPRNVKGTGIAQSV
jgi:hypothetical protein